MQTYDLRGKVCPEGYVLTMRIIDKLRPGESAEVLMDSFECAAMVVYALKEDRRVVAKVDRSGSLVRFTFTRV